MVGDHQRLSLDCAEQLKQLEALNETNESNCRLIEDLKDEKEQAQQEAGEHESKVRQLQAELSRQ